MTWRCFGFFLTLFHAQKPAVMSWGHPSNSKEILTKRLPGLLTNTWLTSREPANLGHALNLRSPRQCFDFNLMRHSKPKTQLSFSQTCTNFKKLLSTEKIYCYHSKFLSFGGNLLHSNRQLIQLYHHLGVLYSLLNHCVCWLCPPRTADSVKARILVFVQYWDPHTRNS